jgi:hypothetical protein
MEKNPDLLFDSGSGIRDGKNLIRDKHLGSATLGTIMLALNLEHRGRIRTRSVGYKLGVLCVQSAPCKHPIIILKDTCREEASAMLEFAYTGEVSL